MRIFGLLIALITCCVLSLRTEAQAQTPHPKPSRPLIFLPGIAGSELWLDGKLAWGSASAMLGLANLGIPDGPRSVSAAPTCDPANHDAKYRATCGPINDFVILGPIKFGQYEPLFKYLETLGYARFGSDRNLFIFSYDWRRSNFDTATDLDTFIKTTPELAGKEIDILAHSMGGLVSLIYAHQFDAPTGNGGCDFPRNCRIKTVVTMGTPFWGSSSALSTPVLGWGWLSRKLAGGQDTITRTVLSWPSLYELLPIHEPCCTVSDGRTQRSLDLLKAADFVTLPFDLARTGISMERISVALQSAADLKKLVDLGFPKHVRNANVCKNPRIPLEGFFAIAGDHTGTQESLNISGGVMNFVERRGDGTVLLRSATFGYPAGAFLSFSKHLTIFDDENARAKIEDFLFRCEMSARNFNRATPMVAMSRSLAAPTVLPIDFVSAKLEDVTTDGLDKFQIHGILSLAAPDDAMGPKAVLLATLNGTEFYRAEIQPKSKRLDGSTTRFDYEHGPVAVSGTGLVEIEMTFGQNGPSAFDETYVIKR
jgi:pimeloyl-ACP methyl ester carboxylesterase